MRTLAVAAVALVAFGLPATGRAAERLVAVTSANRLVFLHSDTLPARSRPAAVAGLPADERVRALDRTPDGQLLALTSSSAIFAIDPRALTARRRLRPVTAPLGAGTVTFAVAPDGATARLIAGGRDLTVDLGSGAVTQNAAPVPPVAADFRPDGRLVGVDREIFGWASVIGADCPTPRPGCVEPWSVVGWDRGPSSFGGSIRRRPASCSCARAHGCVATFRARRSAPSR